MKYLQTLLLADIFLFAISLLQAQTPPHPNGGSNPGIGSTPVGGGAPISGGLFILLTLSAGYGAKRVYHIYKDSKETKDQ